MLNCQTMPKPETVSERPGDERSEPWGVVVLLLVLGILNYLDRMLPGILAEPIRKDLGLSDTMLGLINGFGFLLIYAASGIPIARLADRGRYATVISISLALWSGMTALGSLARTGLDFGVTRLGVALGEAGATPASHAFISRRFGPETRARALSIVSLGASAGGLLGMIAGGYAGGLFGWRNTFLIMGLIGLALAPLSYFVMRGTEVADVARPVAVERSGRWTDLFRTRSGALTVAASAMIAAGAYATNAFAPAFLMRVHGLSIGETGVQLGLVAGLGGMFALLGTGWLADWLARSDARWTLGVLAGAMLLSVPLLILGYTVGNSTAAVILIGAGAACMNSYLPLAVVVLYRLVPEHVRARTSATLLFSTAVVGGSGPLLVGLASDAMAPGAGRAALGYAMLIVPCFSGLAALLYFAALSSYRQDIVRIGNEPG